LDNKSILFKEVGDIKRHFNNFSVVVLFDFLQELVVRGGNEVNGNTLSTETSRSSDSVNVLFLGKRKIEVDNEGNLLNINTSGK
jgi:hypothetical protein